MILKKRKRKFRKYLVFWLELTLGFLFLDQSNLLKKIQSQKFYFWVLHSTLVKEVSFSKLYKHLIERTNGYLACISCSGSQVISDISWFTHKAFTNGIAFLHSYFSLRSKIRTGCSSYDGSSSRFIWSGSITWEESWTNLRSYDTWNTLWTLGNSGGNSS